MSPSRRRPRVKRFLSHDRQVLFMALAAGLPAVVVSLALLLAGDYSPKIRWTLGVLVIGAWWGFSAALRNRVVYPLQTLSNLLAGLREGDASVRARLHGTDDALGEVMAEANTLAGTLRENRLGALEATALLRKVMEEIDVVVFTFDGSHRLRLVNRAGARLLALPSERLMNSTAEELGLDGCLEEQTPRVIDMAFPGGVGKWEVRHGTFRQGGLPHHLLVLTDVSRPLRDEERQAWQRLMRVLGHEINNSLAPIKSIAGSLAALVRRPALPDDWREDAGRGLDVVAARAEALTRFTAAYARLARLPQPRLVPLDIAPLVDRVAGLETRVAVGVRRGPAITIHGDSDQLEQLLINLVRNAVDASLETSGGAAIGWTMAAGHVEISVEDEGHGLGQTANLFVPFFTTKPGGSGSGLVLSRQIAEAHGGTLTLENRKDRTGCRATLRLPRSVARSAGNPAAPAAGPAGVPS
jgi:two-component system, NtrC family, nitrogen regulation sensor histidine kinase NtrY